VVDVRLALDISTAESLVTAIKGTKNPDLEALVDEMEHRSARNEAFLEEDREFHSVLASRMGNRLIQQLVTAFWEVHSAVYPQLGLAPAEQLDQTARAHRSILAAAEAGDVSALRAAFVDHYEPLRQALGMPQTTLNRN
jgi:DNA-binding FadR family transcriptional regulator